MLIATWNVNSLNARMPRVTEWIDQVRPDVLCLQETKMSDAQFPALDFTELGYDSVHHGEGRWNGVAILSRVGLEDPVNGFDDGDEADPDARIVWATCGGVRIASVYVPNGRELDHDHYRYKLDWLARLRRISTDMIRRDLSSCSATGTSRRPTSTSGTRRPSWAAPMSASPNAARSRRSRTGAWSTRCGSAIPTRGSTASGTTATATSTSGVACASTTS